MQLKRGYKQTEVGVVPNDWKRCSVRQMGQVITGKALAARAPGPERPYLRTKNVFDGRIDISDVLTMPMTDEQFAHFMVRPGDVLLNEGQSLELVGRCAVYRGEYPEPCAIQNQLLRFRARSGVSGEFACHLFRRCQHAGVFARVALQTTSIAHLGGRRFEQLCLAWPPTDEEQTNIAEALSDVDGLIESLDRLIAKKRAIKQAAMQQLLRGKIRLPGFGAPWTERRLGHVSRITMGRTPGRAIRKFWGSGHRWIAISDMHGRVIRDTAEQITDAGAVGIEIIPAGTLIMSFKLSIGRLAFTGADMYSNEAICAMRDLVVDPRFMYYALRRVDFSLYGKQAVKGYTLNKQSLKTVEVYMPEDQKEQQAIGALLGDLDEDIEMAQRRRDKTRALKQGMMQVLLTGRIRLPITAATEVVGEQA